MERVALVNRLVASDLPVVSVVAPPGYGKSTLLAQWAERRGRRVAWISCERVGDDPQAVWAAMVAALGLAGPRDEAWTGVIDADPRSWVNTMTDLFGALTRPVTMVFDQVDTVSNRESGTLFGALAMAVPTGSQLALASRERLPLPIARMRVERRLLEIGTADLAMSRTEASLLLKAAGAEVSEAATDQLVRQTEGWPAALCLAALAMGARGASPVEGISGDDRPVRDYLRCEVLERIPRRQATFLLHTSILERVNGDLGAAVAGIDNDSGLLERCWQQNLLVEPVDGRGDWYRYHPLFRQLLQAELARDSPDLIPELHSRAAVWFEAAGDLEEAMLHAHLAGDAEQFTHLVLEAMQPAWASGGVDSVQQWIERLGHRAPASQTPAMMAHGALIFGMLGREGDSERWAALAQGLRATGVLPDGSTVEGTLAYLRANLCCDGPATMRRDSALALQGLSPTSPYRATMLHTEGLSYLLEGNLEQADAAFTHAYDVAACIQTIPVSALLLAERFLVAVEREDWIAADSLIERSLDLLSRGPFDGYWTSALVYAAAAHASVHRGDLPAARRHLIQANLLRPLLTYALPVVSVQALLELGRTYLAMVDYTCARDVAKQIRGILRQRPELGTLVTATRHLDDQLTASPLGGPSLTAAELRLMPLLPTRLTLAEIGERLFVSENTAKTHAGSVYRKLAVRSRAQAVERMTELGLF